MLGRVSAQQQRYYKIYIIANFVVPFLLTSSRCKLVNFRVSEFSWILYIVYVKLYTCKVCNKEYKLVPRLSTRCVCSRECLAYYRNHWKEFLSQETIEKIRNGGKKSA